MKSFKQFLIEDAGETTPPKKMSYHEGFHNKLKKEFGKEYNIIMSAAERNGIKNDDYDNLSLLFSIRKAENGKHGKQFGILDPRAGAKPGENEDQSLDRQAGWASATILKNRQRYSDLKDNKKDFVTFIGERWAPIGVENDPTNLNKNWIPNVGKFKSSYETCEGEDCEVRPNMSQQIQTPQSQPKQKSNDEQSNNGNKPVEQKPTEQQVQPNLNSPAIPPLGGTKKR